MANEEQVALRLPADLVERADALVNRVADDPQLAGLGRVTRSSVLRLALAKGLDVLDQETKPRRPKKPRRSTSG